MLAFFAKKFFYFLKKKAQFQPNKPNRFISKPSTCHMIHTLCCSTVKVTLSKRSIRKRPLNDGNPMVDALLPPRRLILISCISSGIPSIFQNGQFRHIDNSRTFLSVFYRKKSGLIHFIITLNYPSVLNKYFFFSMCFCAVK